MLDGSTVGSFASIEARCSGDSRIWRHEDFGYLQNLRKFDRLGRTGAAECYQQEIAGIEAALDGFDANGRGHILVDDFEHSRGALDDIDLQSFGQTPYGVCGLGCIELQTAGKNLRQSTENHVCVGHRRVRAATAIGSRTWERAGTARADMEAARGVEIGDAAAAGSD
jgi:hypothetical protein